MSGHSKWNNIKRKKEKTDGAKAKVFTKIGREISVAVRTGGPNPASNSKLADLISKAKRMSVPNDNIQRIIKKAEGGDKTEYEAITYEGYGPGGVAVMVETLTDNRNRTAADLRHYFDKNGGNLGAMGCVGFLFSQKGVIDISLEDKDADEAMMDALDAGAEDFDAGEEAAEITTDPENYSAVVKAMEEKGYEILSDDLAMVPMTTTRLTDPDQLKLMGKLLDALEDNDDVQNVWHSLEKRTCRNKYGLFSPEPNNKALRLNNRAAGLFSCLFLSERFPQPFSQPATDEPHQHAAEDIGGEVDAEVEAGKGDEDAQHKGGAGQPFLPGQPEGSHGGKGGRRVPGGE